VPPRPISFGTLAAYGAPVFAVASLFFFVQFYFLKFATDVLLLSPAVVSVLFAAAKVWDGVSAPLIGSWSDRTRSRLGRRRPFMLGALPLLALGFWMIWSAPQALSGTLLMVWIGVALFVFFSAFDLYTLPHMALGAEFSTDSHQRARLFAARQMSFTVGILLAFAGIQIAMNAAQPRAVAAELAGSAALLAAVVLAVTPIALREPARGSGPIGGRGLVAGLRDVLATRPARRLIAVQLIEAAGVGAVGTMAPYASEYVLRRPEVVGLLSGGYVISSVLAIPFWVWISKRFGRRETWIAAMLLAAAAFAGIFFVRAGEVARLVTLLVVAGIAMGCGGVLASAILADVIDLDERRTGERKEAIYSAAMTLALKLGTALALGVSGPVMAAAGFVPNVEQSEASLLGIRILFAGMPCMGFLVGAWLFRGFSLSEPAGAVQREPALNAP